MQDNYSVILLIKKGYVAEKIQKNLWLTPEQRDKLDATVVELNSRLRVETGVSEIGALALDLLLREPISEIRKTLLEWREAEPIRVPKTAAAAGAELGKDIVDRSVADSGKASRRGRRRAREG